MMHRKSARRLVHMANPSEDVNVLKLESNIGKLIGNCSETTASDAQCRINLQHDEG